MLSAFNPSTPSPSTSILYSRINKASTVTKATRNEDLDQTFKEKMDK